MAINYTSTNIPVGNTVFGLTSFDTVECWGTCFVENNRFALILVKSGAALYWKKLDVLAVSPVYYDMEYSPTFASILPTDIHPTKGNFLCQDGGYIYYVNNSYLYRINAVTGAADGSKILRNASSVAVGSQFINHILVKGTQVYALSKANTKLYHWDIAAFDGGTTDALEETTVPELVLGSACGLYAMPGADTDVVVVTKNTAKLAIKYTATLVRKGESYWTDPSSNITLAILRGSIIYMVANDELTAGAGLYIYKYGDGSTGIIAPNETIYTISSTQIKAATSEPLTLTFSSKDGFGVPFQPTDFVRFSLIKQGDMFDKNDGALSDQYAGPFRDNVSNPINTQLDLTFDSEGSVVLYWQAPLEIQAETVMHRIRVQYPIPA